MLLELFLVFLKLGAFTIGGGVAMIPILQDAMVNDKKWFSEEEMVDVIAICQSIPGVIAINMATYVGFKKRGFLGSLVATIGVLLPSFLIILFIAKGGSFLAGNRYVEGLLFGFRAASAGLVIYALYNIAKTSIRNVWQLAGALVCLALIVFFDVPIALVVISFLAIGVFIVVVNDKRIGGEKK